MSGIYLTVWDDDRKHESAVLRPTQAGWPHLTLAYTGKLLAKPELLIVAQLVLAQWALKPITFVSAYVSSWEPRPGVMRHDVLLEIAEEDAAAIENTRETYLKCHSQWEQFTMRRPHVTHSVHSLPSGAAAEAKMLNEIYLPYKVAVTGLTIGSKPQ